MELENKKGRLKEKEKKATIISLKKLRNRKKEERNDWKKRIREKKKKWERSNRYLIEYK